MARLPPHLAELLRLSDAFPAEVRLAVTALLPLLRRGETSAPV